MIMTYAEVRKAAEGYCDMMKNQMNTSQRRRYDKRRH